MLVDIPFRDMTSSWEDFCTAVRSASPLIAVCLVMLWHGAGLHTVHNVIVRRRLAEYRFELEYEDSYAAGVRWVQRICADYSPDDAWMEEKGFAPGMILDEVNFVDEGSCWSLNPDNQASWFNRKDAYGNYQKEKGQEVEAQNQNPGFAATPSAQESRQPSPSLTTRGQQ